MLFSFFVIPGLAQTSNPCGVKAGIWPGTRDSVVKENTLVAFQSTSINDTSVTWLLDGYFSGVTGPLFNYQVSTGVHTISLVAYRGQCSDTTTVVYFSPGLPHNIDTVMQSSYGWFDTNEEGTCLDKTLDSGFVLGGVQYLWKTCGEAGIVVKMTKNGCVEWSKKLLLPFFYCNVTKITAINASADGSYYLVINERELIHLDKNGNLDWIKNINLVNQGLIGTPIITTDPDGYLYSLNGAYNNGWSLTKLRPDGSVIWNKMFRLSYHNMGDPGPSEFAGPLGMIWLNGHIYVSGSGTSIVNPDYFSFLTKVDAVTGAKQWQYGFRDPDFPGGVMSFTHLSLYDTLLMATGGGQGQMVTLINQDGQLVKSIKAKFASSYGPHISRAASDSKGHIFMMQWTEESLSLQPYYFYATTFAEIDTALNKFGGTVHAEYSRGYFTDAAMSKDDKFAAVGQDYGYVENGTWASRNMSFVKVDSFLSNQLCSYSDNTYSIAEKKLNRFDFNYLVDSSQNIVTTEGLPIVVSDAYVQSRYTCQDFIDSCSFMRISGPVTLCNVSDAYTFFMHRNKKCTLKPNWKLPNGVSLLSQTDSTITIKFLAFGTYNISASLNSCIPVKDSLIVSLSSKSHVLDLGEDTSLCRGSSIILHASKDFFSYLWSDGTTDSVLLVSQPGTYWVKTIDACNNVLRDTILIVPFTNSIDLGPDRISCLGDTVMLNAPAGYLNYQWANNYRISSLTSQNVIVDPGIDTAYYMRAEKSPGCYAYDTVKIKVNSAPLIQLGPDKSFCFGDSSILNAGAGFAKYSWSNGSAGQLLPVFTAGNYSVIATDSRGCKSMDSIAILAVWPKPLPKLDHNPELCEGSARTLDAGTYSSYLWQDNSKKSFISISTVGNYYVTVVDINGCKGSDTVHVVRVLTSPSHFLPADTAVCSYGEIVIKPKQAFSSYLWSTGQTGHSIIITKPGIYSLRATDGAKCAGSDTINVLLKDCMDGLYVPSAFTPNSDGRNDLFKPLLFGNIATYKLLIYGRYGQLIFTSDNPAIGWDGRFKGELQGTGGYVWVCRYALKGEREIFKTGSVLLLH